MSDTFIKISKRNMINRGDFVKLIEDPKTHIQFLRHKITIETNGELQNILDDIEELSTDIYFVDVIGTHTVANVYFYSNTDFSKFRR